MGVVWRTASIAALGISLAAAGAKAQSGPSAFGFNGMVRTNQGDDIGHNKGYSTAALLMGTSLDRAIGSGFFFLDLRGHVENNGNIGYNLGGGWRYVDWGSSDKGVYGIHAGFDGRRYACQAQRTCDELTFHWFNLGLERLGERIDVRGNAYFNAGDNRKYYGLTAVGFEGNTLQVARNYAEALWGFDGEVGGRFAFGSERGFKAYAALGGYHFDAREGKDATGARARFEVEPIPYVSLGVKGSIDSRFDTSIMGRATIKFGQPPRSDRASDAAGKSALARLIEFRERQELVVADDGVSRHSKVLTDASGMAVPFVHVDNTAPDGGDGTYEHRYNDLSDINGAGTDPGDIIILYAGDGTAVRYDQGAQLKANQYLLGQGAFGNYTFAETPVWFTLPGGRPTIANVNVGGDALTLASGVTVDGIDVVGAQRNGFFADGITSATIRNVSFRDNLNDGLYILNATGTVLVEDSSCTGNGFAMPVHARTAVDCIDVKSAATGDLDIIYRRIVSTDNYGNGLEASAYSSGLTTILIEDNYVAGNTEGGIAVENGNGVSASNAVVTIRNNQVVDNNWEGIIAVSAAGTAGTNVSITGNLVSGNGFLPDNLMSGYPNPQLGAALRIQSNSSPLTVLIDNNTIVDNAGTGVFLQTGVFNGTASMNARVTNNVITGNGAFAAAVPNSWQNGVTAVASNTSATFTATMSVLVENNVLSDNASYGFAGYTLLGANATVCARVVDNAGNNTAHLASQSGSFANSPVQTIAGGGTFNLEPSTGTFTTVGTINNVPAGTCNY